MERLTVSAWRAAFLVLALAACSGPEPTGSGAATYPGAPPEISRMIAATAARHGVPGDFVHAVVARESGYQPGARNGPYYGLMQIHPDTARTMGYRGGPSGLLDARTNLEFGVRYLRGAWLLSGGDRAEAYGWYARGYYHEAKRQGMLEETGLR